MRGAGSGLHHLLIKHYLEIIPIRFPFSLKILLLS